MKDTLKNMLSGLHPDVDFAKEETLIERGILDSFDIVTLVSEIDGEFGIVIPPEELTPENFCSLDALFALVLRLKP